MLKIILNGCCGKMGKQVLETIENHPDLSIAAGIDIVNTAGEDFAFFNKLSECNIPANVILDFSRPTALNELILYSKANNLPIVFCTTGYSTEQLSQIEQLSAQVPVFRSANMSLGINIIKNVLEKITPILYKSFDIEIIEKHHNQKADAPSGTALLLAEAIKASITEKTEFIYGRYGLGKRKKDEIGIHAIRGGSIVGEHNIIFAGTGETIELSHSAVSREVFASGALMACEFISVQKPGLYNMDDIINAVES